MPRGQNIFVDKADNPICCA